MLVNESSRMRRASRHGCRRRLLWGINQVKYNSQDEANGSCTCVVFDVIVCVNF